ncbi:DUF2169 domain-containing protein [Enhygromyxa salina]|uniref:DUF2169 domain-containing protein n=1 Tax=Enhygromyxa salina TaxID=215803 RepID=UPI000D03E69C
MNGRAKVLTVFGERSYDGIVQLGTSSPAEFTSCPIRYELAFGGTDTADPDPKRQRLDPRNPIGRGEANSLAALRGKPAHRIEYPGASPVRSGPAGFGALASYWSPRLDLAGTYGQHWEQTKRPLLPDDYDPRCLSCSPQDQRPPGQWLIGGERIELVNMTPSGALSFEVPGHVVTFRSLFGRRAREHVGQIASVVVDAEDSRVIVVWHSSLAVEPDKIDYLDKTIIEVT